MQKKHFISIKIEGKKDGQNLSLQNLDITEIKDIISDIENLLLPFVKDRKEETIGYSMEEGSILHKFLVPPVLAVAFQSILDKVETTKNLDFLDKKQIEIIEKYQKKAKSEDIVFSLNTSEKQDFPLKITKKTNFNVKKTIWVDTEQYVYGEVFEAGGKDTTNIHLNTTDFGNLIIKASKEQAQQVGQYLYKEIALLIRSKQNLETGKLKEAELVSFENFRPQYNEDELNQIIKRVSPQWKNKNVDEWLTEIREGGENA